MFTSFDMYGHSVGVNYKGNGVYQTRLGAAVTLVTYALMLFNLVTLISAFFDGSKQEEKTQTSYADPFLTDAYNLAEHNFGIQLTQLPASIGTFQIMHVTVKDNGNQNKREIETKLCSAIEGKQESLDAYFDPRFREGTWGFFRESMLCLEDEDLYI